MSSDGDTNLADHPLAKALNVATNYVSFGTVGFDQDKGQFSVKSGAATHAADESLGEITGRNIQRESAAKADAAVNQEAINRQDLLNQQRQQNYQADLNASNQAAGIRRSLAARNGTGMAYQPLGDEKDFLGI